MAVSAVDPIGRAWERMLDICFRPFDLNKWFALGLCAFLAQLGRGGGNFPSGNGFGGGGKRQDEQLDQAFRWIQDHLTTVVLIAAGVLLLAVALGALIQWLSSRGQFMFLDGVLKDRGAVKEPWAQFRDLGNALFLFRFLLGLSGMVVLLLLLGAGAWAAWPAIQAKEFGARLVLAILVPGCLFLLVAFALGLVEMVLGDFGVPIMYRLKVGPWRALQIFARELLPGHLGAFVVFYVMSILIGLAAAVVMMVGICLTCCLAALPYISSVVFLPVFVFFRCYGLCFLAEFGPGWDLWPRPTADRRPPTAGESPAPAAAGGGPTHGAAPPETAGPAEEPPKPFEPA